MFKGWFVSKVLFSLIFLRYILFHERRKFLHEINQELMSVMKNSNFFRTFKHKNFIRYFEFFEKENAFVTEFCNVSKNFFKNFKYNLQQKIIAIKCNLKFFINLAEQFLIFENYRADIKVCKYLLRWWLLFFLNI